MSDVEKCDKLIIRNGCILIVIDIQEKLIPVIANREAVINNTAKLVKFANIIGIPIVFTEQEKLGPTVMEIRPETGDIRIIRKESFNCFGCREFSDYIQQNDRKILILAGVEAHICISQTALSALYQFKVHVVSDATSSRKIENWKIALERMRAAGAVITSTEMFIYEILGESGTDEFRAALALVK
jgi:nicotinamidase-related amidase